MKTIVLLVSRNFPATHKRKGEPTGFESHIICTLNNDLAHQVKIHTIRANYPFWAKRIEQVRTGEAILSIRYWSGKPYNSKQVEICQFDKDDGVGIQGLNLDDIMITGLLKNNDVALTSINGGLLLSHIAKNDGLSLEDFKEWFRKYDITQTMAIIHFTKFRY